MSTRELDLLRRTTEALIRSRPTRIQMFRPPELVEDGFGGFVQAEEDPITLEPRDRYFAPTAEANTMLSAQEEKGEIFFISHMLIGPYDDEMQARDFFFHNEVKYIVAAIDPERSYQTKAIVGSVRKVFIP